MYRGIDGSTVLASKIFLALTNLAIVKPAAGEPTAICWLDGCAVLALPSFPVLLDAKAAATISSSIARPIAAAAALAYVLSGEIKVRTISWLSIRSAHS